MNPAKVFWPIAVSTLVMLIGILLFLAPEMFTLDWSNPDPILIGRGVTVLAQVVIGGAAVYGAFRAADYRFVLIIATVVDVLIGLGFSIAGWIQLDRLAAAAAGG